MEIAISGVGMVSPVGENAARTFTSVRAGICRTREWPDIYHCLPDDPLFGDPVPVKVAGLDYLNAERARHADAARWLAHLASLAYADLRTTVKGFQKDIGLARAQLQRTGMYIALPPPRPEWERIEVEDFSCHFHNAINHDHFIEEEYSLSGHAGGIALMDRACGALREGLIDHALVGGVDSWVFEPWLRWLDENHRLHSPRNFGGFIPGENAAFVLLEAAERASARRASVHGRITGIRQGSSSNEGDPALSDAIAPLLDGLPRPPFILCDLNGEPARMKEWGYAQVRLGKSLGVPPRLLHPATSLGDLGAAAGPALTCLAAGYLKRPRRRLADHALVWAASDNGDRGVLMIEHADGPTNRHDASASGTGRAAASNNKGE